MTSAPVLSFQAKKQAIRERRLAHILSAVERAQSLPLALGEEAGTGDLVASPEDWAFFESIFEAFFFELPRDVNAKAAIGGVVYLAGHLGSKLKLRLANEGAYQRVRKTMTAAEYAFIESLFGDDLEHPRALIKQLNVLAKQPADFA